MVRTLKVRTVNLRDFLDILRNFVARVRQKCVNYGKTDDVERLCSQKPEISLRSQRSFTYIIP